MNFHRGMGPKAGLAHLLREPRVRSSAPLRAEAGRFGPCMPTCPPEPRYEACRIQRIAPPGRAGRIEVRSRGFLGFGHVPERSFHPRSHRSGRLASVGFGCAWIWVRQGSAAWHRPQTNMRASPRRFLQCCHKSLVTSSLMIARQIRQCGAIPSFPALGRMWDAGTRHTRLAARWTAASIPNPVASCCLRPLVTCRRATCSTWTPLP